MSQMEERQRQAEELKRQIEENEKERLKMEVPIATTEEAVDNSEKELMQQHILELKKQNDEFLQQYQRM